MLPTLAVILWAYGMYALFSLFFPRQGGCQRGRSRWRKVAWLTVMGGVGAGLGLIFWGGFSPDKSEQRLRLAGFLGTVYAEGWPGRVNQVNYPPVKTQPPGTGGQPVYSLLHPETPVSQLEPEKKPPKPRPNRAAKKGSAAGSQGKAGKVTKTTAPPAKKDKVAAKQRAKKKRSPAARPRPAGAG